MKKTFNRETLCFFVLVCAFLTNGCIPGAPSWKYFEAESKSEKKERQSLPATDNLVVYLDTSRSMAGYVATDGNTIFGKTLMSLRDVATTLNAKTRVVLRTVDVNVSAPNFDELQISRAASSQGIYLGQETNLAGAIKSFSEPLDKAKEGEPPPRFHILVTDGVQSGKGESGDCLKGSDSFCVKKQLRDLLSNGWSGAVIGLRSEFKGNVFSEMSQKNIPYSSGTDLKRMRPFYLYIFSPDFNELEKLVERLKNKLNDLGTATEIREFSLTSDYVNGVSTADFDVPGESKNLIKVKEEPRREGKPTKFTVNVDLDTEREKQGKPFNLKVKVPWTENAGGTSDEIAGTVKWELVPVKFGKANDDEKKRYPNFKIIKQEVANGELNLTFETGWTKEASSPGWLAFRLIGKLDVEKQKLPWISQWSTNDDRSAANADKTLNLESSLGDLWNNDSLNKEVGEIWLRVGPK